MPNRTLSLALFAVVTVGILSIISVLISIQTVLSVKSAAIQPSTYAGDGDLTSVLNKLQSIESKIAAIETQSKANNTRPAAIAALAAGLACG